MRIYKVLIISCAQLSSRAVTIVSIPHSRQDRSGKLLGLLRCVKRGDVLNLLGAMNASTNVRVLTRYLLIMLDKKKLTGRILRTTVMRSN